VNKGLIGLSFVLLLVGAAVGYVLSGGNRSVQGTGDGPDRVLDLEKQLARLSRDVESLTVTVRAALGSQEEVKTAVRELSDSVRRLSIRPVDSGGAGAAVAVEDGGGVGGADDRPPAAAEEAPPTEEEFGELLGKVMGRDGQTATAEEQERFWKHARSSGMLDDMVKEFEGAVEDDPEDVEARMDLSRSYVAKVLTVPVGPERGTWAMKAETQWQEVLARDPEHWEAQFSLGVSWSQWPDLFNKTPDAIKAYERAREIQEAGDPQPLHAQTYLHLSRLYLKQGNAEKAQQALEQGLERHPGDQQLAETLKSMQE
jgi:tetratricopeptide (TPR) repeat protein